MEKGLSETVPDRGGVTTGWIWPALLQVSIGAIFAIALAICILVFGMGQD